MLFFTNNYLTASQKYQPLRQKTFALKANNKIQTDKQVIGILINGEVKAYPIQLLAYHHFVSDTVGSMPVLITYCSICRSARVFDLLTNGRVNKFKLIGVNRFNAVLQDSITKSWWQQETGKAIAGPMKGKYLKELAFGQYSLSSWLHQYPDSKILQPDLMFTQVYALMDGYEQSAIKGNVMQVDSATYAAKSLVVGVVNKNEAKCYDWNKLKYIKIVQDSLAGTPLLLTVDADNTSFHVWKRNIKHEVLHFEKTANPSEIKDINTSSVWNMNGECIEGDLTGTQLNEVQSYQETRESWQDFHQKSEEYTITY